MNNSTPSCYGEKTPLLQHSIGDPQVVPMKRVRGADAVYRAFTQDSLMMYFVAADSAPFREARQKAGYYIMFDAAIRQRRMLTVDDGKAVMKYGAPGDGGPPRLHRFLTWLGELSDPPELTKRKKEFMAKVVAMVSNAFGEKVADMYEVQALATAPEAQGRGYATALVNTVTDRGDAEGRDVWLITADAYAFYEWLGFSTIRSELVGVDNPTWDGAPITIRLMHRPAKKADSTSEKPAFNYTEDDNSIVRGGTLSTAVDQLKRRDLAARLLSLAWTHSDMESAESAGSMSSPDGTKQEEIEVKPMKYGDLFKAVDSVQRIIADEALMFYFASADTAPFFKTRWKLRHGLLMLDGIRQKRMLTVNGGESVLYYRAPGNNKHSLLSRVVIRLLELFDTAEVKKRKKESTLKVEDLVNATFGGASEKMYEIGALVTAPEAQGRGYASALVTTVTGKADSAARDTWLLTTSAYLFYETLGFVVVGERTVGENNPTWDGPPVILRAMQRLTADGEGSV
ncbi:hypothetical protein OH77DRAFT_1512994 [Trametes cingulata]|nr:hypothetical protein OH77DRAFT_1512994 [Trametes cingulata]